MTGFEDYWYDVEEREREERATKRKKKEVIMKKINKIFEDEIFKERLSLQAAQIIIDNRIRRMDALDELDECCLTAPSASDMQEVPHIKIENNRPLNLEFGKWKVTVELKD